MKSKIGYHQYSSNFKEALKKGRNKGYVLYQICGTHPVYGSDLLLYVGKTDHFAKVKLEELTGLTLHEEYDRVKVRLGSDANWFDWDHWWNKAETPYPAPKGELKSKIEDIKKLLVIANHPLYNTKYKTEDTIFHPHF